MPGKRKSGIREGFPHERLLVVPEERLRQARTAPVLRDLLVTRLGMFHEARNHEVSRRSGVPEHVLIYCLSGRGRGATGKISFSLEAGDLVVLPPDVSHRYHADETFPWTIFWFHFRGKRAVDYVAALGREPESLILHAPRVDEFQRAFEETYRHALDGFSDAGLLGIATGFMRMIGLFRRHARSKNQRTRRAEDRILEVVAVLQEKLAEPWTVDRMAGLAGMSRAHFAERFKAQTGEPPLQYVTHQRMQRAAALLQRGGESVANIGAAVGYEDPYYFSRMFKVFLGVPPRAYRQLAGEEGS